MGAPYSIIIKLYSRMTLGRKKGRKGPRQSLIGGNPLSSVAEGVMAESLKLNVTRASDGMVAVDG